MLKLIPGTQRSLAIGSAMVATLIALINLAGGPTLNNWDQLQPSEVAHRLAMVRL
jgi:hypothetical protein